MSTLSGRLEALPLVGQGGGKREAKEAAVIEALVELGIYGDSRQLSNIAW